MAKNYMQDVARMLGLELGDEFKFRDYNNLDYYGKITDKGVYIRSEVKKDWRYDGTVLQDILTRAYKIEKLPWQPKVGDKYFYPNAEFEHAWCSEWKNYSLDFALKDAGMLFRTAEACEAALPELRKKYLGGESK